MNESDKRKYLQVRGDLLLGCVITKVVAKRCGNKVGLVELSFKHPDGSEFAVLPYSNRQLRVIQTAWE